MVRPFPALCILLGILVPFGCGRGPSGGELTVAGSTSIQPFADKWAEVFMEEHSGVGINVQGGGSSAGIQACKAGACEIGMSSRDLKESERTSTKSWSPGTDWPSSSIRRTPSAA